ncbi:MAG: hypothetical protein EKE20_02175 [Candidatus Symbiopectobacterium sp. Dall1.0]|nr:hypothetical protein [Candidatus Symbiopectobacterium sp. Dall1.0]
MALRKEGLRTTSTIETAGNLERSFPHKRESFAGYLRFFWQRSPTFAEDDRDCGVAISLIGEFDAP